MDGGERTRRLCYHPPAYQRHQRSPPRSIQVILFSLARKRDSPIRFLFYFNVFAVGKGSVRLMRSYGGNRTEIEYTHNTYKLSFVTLDYLLILPHQFQNLKFNPLKYYIIISLMSYCVIFEYQSFFWQIKISSFTLSYSVLNFLQFHRIPSAIAFMESMK